MPTAKQLAQTLPDNLSYLASLIARKPVSDTSAWAATVAEAFYLYTDTTTINLLLAWNNVLAEHNWPFPAYLDLRSELTQPAFVTTATGVKLNLMRRRDMWRNRLFGTPVFTRILTTIMAASIGRVGVPVDEGRRKEVIDGLMEYAFHIHALRIFQFWHDHTLLATKRPIIRDIASTFNNKYWAACIPTTLPILDYVLRSYFDTINLYVSVQTLRQAFGIARLRPKDLKPGFAVWRGVKDPESGNALAGSLENDLRLPGVLLSSFVEFANEYYGYYTVARDNDAIMNRHAVLHCASSYWTSANTVKLLTFLDLALRLEPALRIIIHGRNAPVPNSQ